MSTPSDLELIASDARGIYIPQHVAELSTLEPLPNCGDEAKASFAEAVAICKEGPDTESYWDAWCEILDNGCLRVGRIRWGLYQDGNCWAYRLNRNGRRELAKLTGHA